MADVHPCTEEEYAKFWPAAPGSKWNIETIRKKKGWMCPNDVDIWRKPFWKEKRLYTDGAENWAFPGIFLYACGS